MRPRGASVETGFTLGAVAVEPPLHAASETVTTHLRADGLLVRSGAPGNWLDVLAFPVGAHGIISMVEPDGSVVWEFQLFEPGKRVMHHDFELMPNGNILVTVYSGKTFGLYWHCLRIALNHRCHKIYQNSIALRYL